MNTQDTSQVAPSNELAVREATPGRLCGAACPPRHACCGWGACSGSGMGAGASAAVPQAELEDFDDGQVAALACQARATALPTSAALGRGTARNPMRKRARSSRANIYSHAVSRARFLTQRHGHRSQRTLRIEGCANKTSAEVRICDL